MKAKSEADNRSGFQPNMLLLVNGCQNTGDWGTVLQSLFFNIIKKSLYSCLSSFPPISSAQSDVSSLDLYAFYSVNADPLKVRCL